MLLKCKEYLVLGIVCSYPHSLGFSPWKNVLKFSNSFHQALAQRPAAAPVALLPKSSSSPTGWAVLGQVADYFLTAQQHGSKIIIEPRHP